MDTINELLAYYGLSLADCNEEWVEMVKDFRNEKPAMPAEVAANREQQIVNEFQNYHEVEDERKTEKPPVEKKKATGRPKGSKLPTPAAHNYDEKSLLDKADDIISKIF